MVSNAKKTKKLEKRDQEESEIKEVFSQRLDDLLLEREVTAKVLADTIGLSEGILSKYRKGTVSPSVTKLKKIANYFNVSTDFLLGEDEYEEKEMEDIRKKLRLSKKSIRTMTVLTPDKERYFIKTINALIENRPVIKSISRYLYGEVIPSVPAELGEGYPPMDFYGFLMRYRGEDNAVDINSLQQLDDEVLKHILALDVQSKLEALRATILKGQNCYLDNQKQE